MITITAELAQAIHDYLVTRPMQEVERLVNSLRAQATKKEDTNDDKS